MFPPTKSSPTFLVLGWDSLFWGLLFTFSSKPPKKENKHNKACSSRNLTRNSGATPLFIVFLILCCFYLPICVARSFGPGRFSQLGLPLAESDDPCWGCRIRAGATWMVIWRTHLGRCIWYFIWYLDRLWWELPFFSLPSLYYFLGGF